MYKLNKENRILLLAFFIIIGALISSSVETITGKVINKKVTKVSAGDLTREERGELFRLLVKVEHSLSEYIESIKTK